MAEKLRNRDRGLRRASPRREPKRRILIVSEGRLTEPTYFKELQHYFRNRLVHVEISTDSGVPMTVVRRAIELRDEAQREAKRQRDDNLLFNDVWCVCDVDEHPNLKEACELAAASNISVALSNPCFELWALLHFRDQREQIHRHALQDEVKHLLRTKEDKLLPFDKLKPGYQSAVDRAREQRRLAESMAQRGRNPSTNVDELTEIIRVGGLP